jgi:hypothetical protein
MRSGLLAATLFVASAAAATNAGCEQAVRLQQQGLSVEQIAGAMGLSVGAVHNLCAQPAPRSVVVPNGRVVGGAPGPAPHGAAGPPPLGAAGPAPLGAAGPAPLGAAGPAPFGAAGPAPMGAAGRGPTGGTNGGSTNQITR